jgi:hypothetical protein
MESMENNLIRREKKLGEAIEELESLFNELKEISLQVTKQANGIKDVISADYHVVESQSEEGNFIHYTITHALLCEKLSQIIHNLAKSFEEASIEEDNKENIELD